MKTKKIASIVSKIFTILSWLVVGIIGIFTGIYVFASDWFVNILNTSNKEGWTLKVSADTVDLNKIDAANLMDSLFHSWGIFLTVILSLGLSFLTFRFLRHLFKNVEAEKTFTKESLWLIYGVGIVQIVDSFLIGLRNSTASGIIEKSLGEAITGFSSSPEYILDLTPGMLVLIIGFFFSQGIKLQEEQDLTI